MLTPAEQKILDHYVKLRRHGLRHSAARALAGIGTGYSKPHGLAEVDRILDLCHGWLEEEGLWFATAS